MSADKQTVDLKGQVALARDQARTTLRLVMINRVMEDLFNTKKMLESRTKDLELAKRKQAGLAYDIAGLDVKHPEYQDKLENKKSMEESRENDVKYCTEAFESVTKNIKELEDKISKIESGEIKVSIDDVNCLADENLRKA